MIDGGEKRNRQFVFELQNSYVCEKRSNETVSTMYYIYANPKLRLFFCAKLGIVVH